MAVEKIGLILTQPRSEYIGLSTDTKPVTANPGDTFLELDTNKKYTYGSGAWYNAG